MNWVKSLFSKKKPTSSSPNKSASAQLPEEAILVCSKPVNIDLENPAKAVIQQFIPIRDFDESSINLLPRSVQTFEQGATLFVHKQEADTVFYLMDGIVELQPDSTNSYQVSGGSIKAKFPLDSGKIRGATAIAKTEVIVLVVSGDLARLWSGQNDEDISCTELLDISFPEEIGHEKFFTSFIQAYRANKLILPSLPTVAFKLKEAMKKEIGIREVVEIIQLDIPIVTKLIQVANSPLYAPTVPITNCLDAVNRLGLEATKNLVLSISLKQLFKCKDKQLMKGMQQVWKNSLYTSCLGFVLAEESGKINPDDALLAGLISDIGIIPLLHFAENYPEDRPGFSELEKAMPFLKGPVGMLVLDSLGFSKQLSNIPQQSEDWFYDSNHFDLTDTVIFAKLHSFFGSQKAKGLPYISSLPAYSKLKNGELNSTFSLSVLYKAQKRVNAAMSLLN